MYGFLRLFICFLCGGTLSAGWGCAKAFGISTREGGIAAEAGKEAAFRSGNALPNQLSGGQQQRTSIGRAIIKNPSILLCDEPTGALDYHTSKEILKLIEDVNQKYGNTVIMVTHNDAIKNMADRVIRLRDGQIRKNYVNETKIAAGDLDW